MTDRETLAYIKGLIEASSIDIDLQTLVIGTIDKRLKASPSVEVVDGWKKITTGTVSNFGVEGSMP